MKALAAALALSLALVGATGCGATGAAESPASSAHMSAKTLASIQEGHEPSANDPLIPAIERATLALVPLCNQSITDIDGIADAMSNDLKQHGIMETPLSGLNRLHYIVPKTDGHQKIDCKGVAASYLVLREGKDGGKNDGTRAHPATPDVKQARPPAPHSTQEQRIKHLEEESEEQRREREEEKTEQYVKEQNEKNDPANAYEEQAAEECKRTAHCEPNPKEKRETEKPALGPTPREAEEHPGNGSVPTTASEP
jgi:hypothetical protein